jgi:hypothetical protein
MKLAVAVDTLVELPRPPAPTAPVPRRFRGIGNQQVARCFVAAETSEVSLLVAAR